MNASSGLADRGHPTQTGVSSKQQQLETTLYPERNGFESYDYSNFQAPDFGTARLPWVGNLPPANPEASSYPHTPSLLPGDSSQVPTMWGSPSALNSKRPSVPSSATSSAYGFGHNDVHTSQYDASQQWSSYSTPTDSLGSPPIDYSQHPSYTSWEPQRGSEYLSSYAVGAPPHYASNLASSVDGRSGGTGTAVPTSGPKTSLVDASDRLSTPPYDYVVPRGSGINPAYYKHGKHHRDPSRPKHPKTSRY